MKNIMKSVILLAFLAILLIQPAPIIAATKTGFLTWADKVIPSLFPFFVLTRLMVYYQVPQLIGKLLTPLFKYFLHLSPITFFVMLMSMISGNPSGSKMARDYYDHRPSCGIIKRLYPLLSTPSEQAGHQSSENPITESVILNHLN